MDITTKAKDLARELGVVEQASSRKPTIPILSNVLLTGEADGKRLLLRATDLEIGITTSCEAAVAKPGSTTVAAAKLLEIVRSLPGDADVRLVAKGDKGGVELAGAGFTAQLQSLPSSEFPILAVPPTDQWLKLPRALLASMLTRTRYATSQGDQRYALNVVNLELEASNVRAVATDSHRLALSETTYQTGTKEPVSALLPKRTVDALLDMLASEADEVEFSVGDMNLFFQLQDRLLVSRKVDGKFPAYKKIIPEKSATPATMKREALLNAVRRAQMVTEKESQAVRFQLDSLTVAIAAESVSIGKAAEQVEVAYAGQPVLIGLQGRYVEDFLAAAEGEDVLMELTGTDRACLLRQVGGEVEYLGVVMSMRL